MPRYVTLLRGVSPLNAKMPKLRRCFERSGFGDVKTVLSSGNVVFSALAASPRSLERKAEARGVRSVPPLPSVGEAKRVVTFMRKRREAKLSLPIELHGARILAVQGGEVFTAYVPRARGGVHVAHRENLRSRGQDPYLGYGEEMLDRLICTRSR